MSAVLSFLLGLVGLLGAGHLVVAGASDPFALVLIGFVMPLTVVTIVVVVLRQRSHSAVVSDTAVEIGTIEK